VIHALAGTLSSIDKTDKTVTINNDSDTGGVLNLSSNDKIDVEFDKNLREEAVPAQAFTKQGDTVIAYYYMAGFAPRTVFAVQDLGTAPIVNTRGTVISFNKHQHLLTIRSNSGVNESFEVDDNTAVETSMGVIGGHKFSPEKGDAVRVVATAANGGKKAVLVVTQ
jgi:hypothetical protein